MTLPLPHHPRNKVTSFGIDKRFIGFTHNLSVDYTTVTPVVNDFPAGKTVLGSRYFNTVTAPLYLLTPPTFPSQKQLNAMKTVGGSSLRLKTVPWSLAMPQEAYKGDLRAVVEWGRKNVLGLDLDYLENVLEPTNEVFDAMEGLPCVGGNVLRYNRVHSATGRMVAVNVNDEQGFNILTYPKADRHLLESRYGVEGRLVSLDYSSLEPAVLFTLVRQLGLDEGATTPQNRLSPVFSQPSLTTPSGATNREKEVEERGEDLYSFVGGLLARHGLESSTIERGVLKVAVITSLYGGTVETIYEQLREKENFQHYKEKDLRGTAEKLVELVQDTFCLNAVRAMLVSEAKSNNGVFITNYYNRPISLEDVADYKLVNRYVQSTATDVAMLGFLNVIRELKRPKNRVLYSRVHPAFLLHDAIILDVHNNSLKLLPALCRIGVDGIPGFHNMPFLRLKPEWFNKPLT